MCVCVCVCVCACACACACVCVCVWCVCMCKGDSTFSKLMEMRGSGNFCLKSVQEFQEMGGGRRELFLNWEVLTPVQTMYSSFLLFSHYPEHWLLLLCRWLLPFQWNEGTSESFIITLTVRWCSAKTCDLHITSDISQ